MPRLCGVMAAPMDCVIPAHEKDFEVLEHTVASIRRCCPEIRRIIVISSKAWDGVGAEAAEFLCEADDCWPFRFADFDGCGCSPGWLFQQMLKFYAPSVVPGIALNVLVCDADVIWLADQPITFLTPSRASVGCGEPDIAAYYCTFSAETCPPIRSIVDLHRYDDFVPTVLPGLSKLRPGSETAVCHHAVFQHHVLDELFKQVEESAGQPFWVAFRDAARACQGRASEYELYNAFARQRFPDHCVPRPLAFAVVADFEAALQKPPKSVAFVVAHSHLRGLPLPELRDREGIINGDVQAETMRRVGQGHSLELAALLAGSGML
mmetsp:Transcript_95054/g.268474  ORF Transcript_95054/g.268474 Transcript_95054/m.268474 type:complete len:322 (-) Transcript_95054:86-1051(-)